MISMDDFMKGRDRVYASAFTDAILEASTETLRRANALLERFYESVPTAAIRSCNSGWRPPALNAQVRGAALHSKHMTGHAIDISDDDEALDRWLLMAEGQAWLVTLGLWMEHPSKTPRWCHVQTIPPKSGNRVFMP